MFRILWSIVRWFLGFGWLHSRSRNAGSVAANRYRDIFRFWDGRRWRSIDPLRAWRELDAHPRFRMDLHPAELDAGDREAWEATIEAVHDVFGVTPLAANAKSGLTEEECIILLHSYAKWMAALKKNINLPRTSPAFTGQKSCDGSGQDSGGDSSPVDLEAEFKRKVAAEKAATAAAESTRRSSDSISTSAGPKPAGHSQFSAAS